MFPNITWVTRDLLQTDGTLCCSPRVVAAQGDCDYNAKYLDRSMPYSSDSSSVSSHHVIYMLCYLTVRLLRVSLCRYCAQFELTVTRSSCLRSPLVQWSKQLVKGASLCVECQALVMKDPQLGGGRCRGHGILNRETRWSAVAVPGCHGKWVMKTPHAECQCSPDEQLSFVLVWHNVPCNSVHPALLYTSLDSSLSSCITLISISYNK